MRATRLKSAFAASGQPKPLSCQVAGALVRQALDRSRCSTGHWPMTPGHCTGALTPSEERTPYEAGSVERGYAISSADPRVTISCMWARSWTCVARLTIGQLRHPLANGRNAVAEAGHPGAARCDRAASDIARVQFWHRMSGLTDFEETTESALFHAGS